LQDKPTTGLGKAKALGMQPRLQIIPTAGIGKVIREKCPQGRNEPLIRPDGRLRWPAPPDLTREGIADDLADGHIIFGSEPL
jgi:hypothetical protein